MAGITVLLSLVGATIYMSIGEMTNDWNFGWIGIYLAMSSFGAGNLYATTSGRTSERHYNALSDKIDEVADRQEDLISLVHAVSQHSPDAGPKSPSNGPDPDGETAEPR